MKKLILASVTLVLVLTACGLADGQQRTPRPTRTSPGGNETLIVDVEATTRPTRTPESPLPAEAQPTQALQVTAVLAPTLQIPCYRAQFVSDVTVPDGTVLTPGEIFVKTWRLGNTGSCPWDNEPYLYHVQGHAMGAADDLYAVFGYTDVVPDQTADVSVEMTAPLAAGDYHTTWRIRDNISGAGADIPIAGTADGYSLDVTITVPFWVREVSYAVEHTGFCGKGGTYTISATILANGAGMVRFHWVQSDGVSSETRTLRFMGDETQVVTYEWSPLVPHTGLWVDLYVETPNAQVFERASLNCP